MNITIQKIAEETNLSIATISRILNGKGAHKRETVKLVKDTLQQLTGDYHSSKRFESVGVVLQLYPNFICHPYSYTMLSSILEALAAEGYYAQIIPVNSRRITVGDFEKMFEQFDIKGLLIQELDSLYDTVPTLSKLPLPVIRIGDIRDSDDWYCVHSRSRQAGVDAANYLWSMGNRRFGVVYVGTSDLCQELRVNGFLDQIRQLAGKDIPFWMRHIPHMNQSTTVNAAVELNTMTDPPEAIFCTNSTIARQIVHELRAVGLQVPEDISVISVEDADELAEAGISVIQQPTREMGRLAVQNLVNLLQNKVHVKKETVLPCNLVIRKSTVLRTPKSNDK